MKNRTVSLLTAGCILMNMAGCQLAVHWNLPLWLDSLGTVLCAYALGPVSGALVGLGTHLVRWALFHASPVYAMNSIMLGLVAGFWARRGGFKSLFGTMTACALVTAVSVAMSTPLNILLSSGMTGNLWGDGVIEFLTERGIHRGLAYVLGQSYLEFLDKVITLNALYLLLQLHRKLQQRRENHPKTPRLTGWLLLLCMAGSLCLAGSQRALAAETSWYTKSDYNAYVQTLYNSENGLTCGTANDVAQTSDGILWIGTYAGLYRCNGTEMQLMNHYDSVKNVNCLYVDEEGRMWIGTNDNGLSICIAERITNVVDQDGGLPSNSVRSITRSADGDYYVGTSDAMQVLTLEGGMKLLNTLEEIQYAHSAAADQQGNVAAVTTNGDLFLVRERAVADRLRLEREKEIFTCCRFGPDGRLYVGTSGSGIEIYDVSQGDLSLQGELECTGIRQINSVNFADGGRLIVCSDDGVGYFGEQEQFRTVNLNRFRNSIDHMIEDYQGNCWFTSSRQGLMCLSRSVFANLYTALAMDEQVVNAVEQWQGRLYVGTDAGLDIIDLDQGRQVRDELTALLSQVRIRCIRADSAGNLWICSFGKGLLKVEASGAVTVYDQANGTFCNWVRVAVELADHRVVAAGDLGLAVLRDGALEQVVPYDESFHTSMVLCLMEKENGDILVGTDGDGIMVIRSGQVAQTITRADGLSSEVILRMVPSGTRQGTYVVTSNGLCWLDSNCHVRILDRFPYSNNYDIALWDDKLFVLGSSGIYVTREADLLDGQGELSYDVVNAKRGLKAGLVANSWHYTNGTGRIYLPTDQGVYVMDMNNYGSMQKSYRMKLSAIRVDDMAYPVERGMDFRVSRDALKIELIPEVINYAVEDPEITYQLEGFDPTPSTTLCSQLGPISYSNLPSGEYDFHIAVLDTGGDVLEQSSYHIVKEREFYDNWWFQLYILTVAGIAIAWLTWFVARTQIQRTLTLQEKELEIARKQLQMGNETILAIAKTVDAKDENTSQHSQRVSEYAVLLAERMGFTPAECENLRKAALLHDIGKIGIPDSILKKPDRLTDEEYRIMKTHVVHGAEILKDFTMVDHVVEGALYHHERYDGRGYVNGLKGKDIPVYGRIIGVADAFDAMTQNRVYRKHLDMDYVVSELKRCSGTQFDPEIADIMLDLVAQGKVNPAKYWPKEEQK